MAMAVEGVMNKLLAALLAAVVIVGAFALWRGAREPASQPHVPTWKNERPK